MVEPPSCGIGAEAHRGQSFVAELAGRYGTALKTYFSRRLRNAADAEDMTQEVLLRIVCRLNPQGINKAGPFLFQVARNLMRDRVRAERARTHRHGLVSDRQDSTEGRSPERVIEARQTLHAVLAALGRLNKQTRDIFLLHRLENMRYHEIAKVYGISESAVEKHMMKALASLTKHMNQP